MQTDLSKRDMESGDSIFTVVAISTPPTWPLMPTLSLQVQAWTQDQKTHSEGPKLGYYPSWPMHLHWSIKLLREIGSFTQVNTEILIITVQRWKGQVLIPILEMRKWRNRGEMTCPNSELVGAAAKNRSVSACRPRAFCFASVCAVGLTFK